MSKQKVCHLTSVHPYFDTRIFFKECHTLAGAGYDTHLIAPNARNEIKNLINLHQAGNYQAGRINRIFKTVWDVYFKALSINASLYHFHDPELIYIGLLLKILGKKVIYDVHEDVPRQILSKHWVAKPFRSIMSWLFERGENFSARFFDAVVTATPFIEQRFLKKGKRVVNINNYPILEEWNSKVNWNKKEKAVCYIGCICDIRGIFEMVEAMDKIECKLLLGGEFSPIEQRDQAMNMPGWRNVMELGLLNRVEVDNVMQRSMAGLVVLQPTINYLDSLPVKMFEYMAAGIPVIASRFPLWEKIINENQCGICVDPSKPDEISAAIEYIIYHPGEAQQMGINGRKAVEDKFSWAKEGQKLVTLYEQILK